MTPFGELPWICHKTSSCGFVTAASLIHVLRIVCSRKLRLRQITAPVFILPFLTPVAVLTPASSTSDLRPGSVTQRAGSLVK